MNNEIDLKKDLAYENVKKAIIAVLKNTNKNRLLELRTYIKSASQDKQ